jgi:hypothetical protein
MKNAAKSATRYNNCDIYYVEKVDGFWKKIKPLSIVNLPKNWESQPTGYLYIIR